MDNDAPQPSAVEDLLRRIDRGKETTIDVARDLLKLDGKDVPRLCLKVESRTIQPEDPRPPVRRESAARRHTFHDADGFVAYLQRYATADTVVLADMAAQQIGTVLDENADHGRELLSLAPILHPLFQPWADKIDKRIEISQFALFLTQNRSAVTGGREMALLFAQVRIAKKIEINKGHGTKQLNGVVCQTEIQGTKDSANVQLPESITLHVPIYVGTAAQDIEVDLTLIDAGETVAVALTSANLLEARARTFEEILDAIRGQLDGDGDEPTAKSITVGLGRLGYTGWAYL